MKLSIALANFAGALSDLDNAPVESASYYDLIAALNTAYLNDVVDSGASPALVDELRKSIPFLLPVRQSLALRFSGRCRVSSTKLSQSLGKPSTYEDFCYSIPIP